MTEALQKTIVHLYDLFSKYPFNPTISGCPCCIHEADKQLLHSKLLKELTDEDLSRYAHKAMTTWGTVDDYKHYLPRIIELICSSNSFLDVSGLLSKLDYGNWLTWEKEEITNIQCFLNEWWVDQFTNNEISTFEMIDLYRFSNDFISLITSINIEFKNNSFKNYLDLMIDYQQILNREKEYSTLDKKDYTLFLNWITKNIPLIEEAFFYYETRDPEYASYISNRLYFIENTVKYN